VPIDKPVVYEKASPYKMRSSLSVAAHCACVCRVMARRLSHKEYVEKK
jgi:hypothetical protein